MFRSVYKRHTPFAMSLYQNTTIQGDRRILIDKVGDVLMYTYLYGIVDWVSSIQSIEFHIGGQQIFEWDIDYLCGPSPLLDNTVHSRIHTDTNSTFLPIPIPQLLPVKNLAMHELELFINWKEKPFRIQCFSMFAFVDEELPTPVDVLIHQVKRYTVYDGTPMKLYGPVKYLVSKNIEQPSEMILDGQRVHIQDDSISTYYHSRFERVDFTNSKRYTYTTIPNISNIRTTQRIKNFIFLFSDTGPSYIYDTTKYFGSPESYTMLKNISNVWSSCTDDKYTYATSVEGGVYKCSILGLVEKIQQIDHPVYYTYLQNGKLIFIGDKYITIEGSPTVYLGGATYDGSFQVKNHPDFGDSILMFRNDGSNGVLVINDKIQEYALLTISDVYDKYSSSLFVDGYTYLTSGFDDSFTKLRNGTLEEFLFDVKGKYYTNLVYDGSKFIYIYGQDTIVRFDASAYQYSMLVPFCLDVQDYNPSGFLNFDSIQNVIFKGCGSGTMYAVQYNILRIQNGMAGILYSQ